jgi:anion-transporting  ArsA/GET3 family ATPase
MGGAVGESSPLSQLLGDKELNSTFSEMFSSMPGIDEAMGFMQIMRFVLPRFITVFFSFFEVL